MTEFSYAVMQPYFLPARRYFDLISSVDFFVFFDNAQFPRRGRVHRFEALNQRGDRSWLTLPLEKASQATEIREISLSFNWLEEFRTRLLGYPELAKRWAANSEFTECAVPSRKLFEYLRNQIITVSTRLGFGTKFLNASELRARGINESAENYIIAIGEEIGCTRYRNLSGGIELYSAGNFAKSHIVLEFRPPADDSGLSILTEWVRADETNG